MAGRVGFFSHQDVEIVQRNTVGVFDLYTAEFSFLQSGLNHQQVVAGYVAVVETRLHYVEHFADDRFVAGRDVQQRFVRSQIPVVVFGQVGDVQLRLLFLQPEQILIHLRLSVTIADASSDVNLLYQSRLQRKRIGFQQPVALKTFSEVDRKVAVGAELRQETGVAAPDGGLCGAGLLGGLFQRVAVLQDAESVVVERERVLGGGGAGYGCDQ